MQQFGFVAAAAAIIVARRIMTFPNTMGSFCALASKASLYRQLAVKFFFRGALKIWCKMKIPFLAPAFYNSCRMLQQLPPSTTAAALRSGL
jgi:hypothetical protein